jgi:UvrB/uvrC motif
MAHFLIFKKIKLKIMRSLNAMRLLLDGFFNPNLEAHTFTYDPLRWTSSTMRSSVPLSEADQKDLFLKKDKLYKEFFGDMEEDVEKYWKDRQKDMDSSFPKQGDPNFDFKVTEGEDANSKWKEEVATSKDGTQVYKRRSVEGKAQYVTKQEPTVEDLQALMKKAVDEQKFEEAAKLRDQIAQMKTK